ncbi:MAG: hypothetical protein GY819_02570 [Planctomycetaceae bacterium]|nr:hypothetical protein [Planctomycetaceae bacterium]MCP4461665.1 hypothetical protein [Planctomycetaceae bacterium]MDG1807495.1 hypothetical protein [Pirellulaceae bacterium]MDG2104137.1 hypothetical protein [Pirellulaceae bacterium]
MPCNQLKELYQLCEKNDFKIGSLDIVRLICKKCNVKEVCPAVLIEEYESELTGERYELGLELP